MGEAVLAPKSKKLGPEAYATVMVDGETVRTGDKKSVEFMTGTDDKIKVALVSGKPGEPTHYAMYPGGERVLYQILPALAVWVNGERKPEFSGVGYSSETKQLIFLVEALNAKGAASEARYRRFEGQGKVVGRPRDIIRTWVGDAKPQ